MTSFERQAGIIGVGYEGRNISELVDDLMKLGVSRLVDVRLNPISRKPGLSKTALSRALTDAGISYVHRRELGNPKVNRAGFAGPPSELAQARSTYRAMLDRPEANDALEEIASAGRIQLVALLCFEADQRRCHRDVLLQEAQRRFLTASASKHPRR
jgi:uncharacterized protein (DUF488 family)